MDVVGKITKQPSELTSGISVDFSSKIVTGESIASFVISATASTGVDKTSEIIHTSYKESPKVIFRAQGGEDGEQYNVKIVATMTDGVVAEADVVLVVAEVVFASTDMGFDVSEILPEITRLLKTSVETGAYVLANKIAAINETLRDVKNIYKPEEYYEPDATLSFTNRQAVIPNEYLIWVKLYNSATYEEYKRVKVDDFDGLSGAYWTQRGGKIYLANDDVSARLRYIAKGDDLTEESDTILLPSWYKTGFARMAAGKILEYDGKLGEAERMTKKGHEMIASHLAVDVNQKEMPQTMRIKSVYEAEDLFLSL
jgi:hypothetical protein